MSTSSTTTTSAPRERATDHSVNSVILRGRLVANPELRSTPSGLVANLRLATNDTRQPEFHNVALWGKDAAAGVADLTKGQWLDVTGRLRTRSYAATGGGVRRSTEIVASAVVPFVAN